MATVTNPVFNLLAQTVDLLTCGNLLYAEPRGGQPSRAYAAAALVDDDRVQWTGEDGVWLVRSRTIKNPDPIWYRVLVDGRDMKCQCMDDQYKGVETYHDIMCAHILAAAYREAMRRVFEGEKENG